MKFGSDEDSSIDSNNSDNDSDGLKAVDLYETPAFLNPIKSVHEVDTIVADQLIFDLPLPKELDMTIPIEYLGEISNIINHNTFIVQAYKKIKIDDAEVALDSETIVVSENRKVLGRIHETFGPVERPFYLVKFKENESKDKNDSNVNQEDSDSKVGNMNDKVVATDIKIEDIDNKEIDNSSEPIKLQHQIGSKVYYTEKDIKYVNVPELLKQKGIDASNFYDEEVSAIEDFSDDEKEAMYKAGNGAKGPSYKDIDNTDGNSKGKIVKSKKKIKIENRDENVNGTENSTNRRSVVSYDDYDALLSEYLE
ncbi:hypothetical protein K502DRAFT_325299 [Neoconidiobolus thromboides FSU 785]|nr:hypothetical protein K502DRAFT_325299 [Neoconidiobolus thromboides FSU 785]